MPPKYQSLFLLAVLLWVTIIYSPVIVNHPTLQHDDQSLIFPLKTVDSLKSYLELKRQNKILELQPVRDLSYWLEVQIEKETGYRNSQLVNVLIWVLILAITYLTLSRLFPNSPWNPYLVLALAVHPVATTSVAWTSARKHLLSAFFVIICTYLTILRQRNSKIRYDVFILGGFVLSLFSQPIHVGWPIWFILFIYFENKTVWGRNLVVAGGLLSLAACFAFLNLQYYSGLQSLPQFSDSPPKINPESWDNILNRIRVLGRYVFQLLLPVRPVGLPYRVSAWPSYAGLACLLLIGVFQIRFKILPSIKWLVFLLLPVLVMTVRLTHHAGYDTYILVTLVGLCFLLGESLQSKHQPKYFNLFFTFILCGFSVISYGQAQRWTSDIQIYAQAYKSEGTLLATTGYAKLLIENNELGKATLITEELAKKDPNNRDLPQLRGRVLFLSDIPANHKQELFMKNEVPHPWFQYYFAAFEASQGRPSQAFERLLKSWQADPRAFKTAFEGNEGPLFSVWQKVCIDAGRSDCRLVDQIKSTLTENF